MGRTVKVTKGAEEQAKAGSGDFKPIPAGVYNVTVVEAEAAEIKNGNNAGVTGVRMQFRISDGQPNANRRLFNTVWDVDRWAPKDGKKEGAVNFQFFQFYKALGVEFPEVGEADLPEIEELGGEPLAVKIKITHDDYKYKQAVKDGTLGDRTKGDFLTNEISEFLPEQEDVALDGDDEDDSADQDEFDL